MMKAASIHKVVIFLQFYRADPSCKRLKNVSYFVLIKLI